MIEVAPILQSEVDAFYEVIKVVYNGNIPVPLENRNSSEILESFLAKINGKPVGTYRLVKQKVHFGAAEIDTCGLAMVAVLPEFRKTGVGKQMIQHLNETLYQRKVPLCGLYPFSERYYRQFGYSSGEHRVKITCPTNTFPKFSTSELVGLSTAPISAFSDEMNELYTAFAKRRNGMVKRDEFFWKRRFNPENKSLVAYGIKSESHPELLEGYVLVEMAGSFNTEIEILELIWRSEQGYKGCLAIIRDLAVNKSEVTWIEHGNGPFLSRYLPTAAQVKSSISSPGPTTIMMKVTELKSAIQALAPDLIARRTIPFDFSIGVDDSQLQKTYQVNIHWDGTNIKLVESNGPIPSCSIETFSQLFMGILDTNTALDEGFIKLPSQTHDLKFQDGLNLLFPRRQFACYDFY